MRKKSKSEIAEEFFIPEKILKEVSPELYEEFIRTFDRSTVTSEEVLNS